jgi:hypothetical protein
MIAHNNNHKTISTVCSLYKVYLVYLVYYYNNEGTFAIRARQKICFVFVLHAIIANNVYSRNFPLTSIEH